MTYGPEADALYIRQSHGRAVGGSDAGPFVLDYDADDRVVGVELLAASTVLAPGGWTKTPRPASGKGGHAYAVE
ncbi:DUF2283 domain-containing protein [Brevundimonas sp.]|uniref:DUF2283 domain-containing protein n=1 Tax=Brevundimonas sp. TaxID=1871086 RepID=UPI002ED77352